ncbi:hotdog fold domain-containing protein [Amycolatopsis thermophila]|uniref:Acyl-coenzyme A thioesterase PaaI-like protein n=1 Tax=Amycolatopsis thermophila TaxID=206084 RepID=A0ABU0EVH9_9PSEU|nr:hotdog fold domain-containing protein [Amycolatopsis thermophila]MDQ0379325.1 acyl-coenzyme A thioesterase PaaI-like protein [Amycolatopsis thermophila]
MVSTYSLWQRLSALPGGRRLFSTAICLRVPYFGSVLPAVRELRPGYCAVTAPKWWGVHNHIGTFHAIAACNLAEIAMGMLAESTLPATHRWLPKGMEVRYLAKAETGLRAVAELPEIPEFGDEGVELPVPVVITDTAGTPVVTATITIWVTRKRQ